MGAWEHGSTGAWERGRGAARARCRAFTLVEVVLTILVVGVGLVASMRALPVILRVSEVSHEALVAQRLATDLLAEMAMLPFEDPDGSPVFGPEPGEATTTRASFDDIDDYDNWTVSPPQRKDGQPETGGAGYTRSVLVQSVDLNSFTTVRGDSLTLPKRVTITVTRQGMPPVVITTVRLKGVNREDNP